MAKVSVPPTASENRPEPAQIGEVKTRILFDWSAPLRVFKPLNRADFRRLVIWSIVLGLVLIFFKEFFLALALFAVLFFSYVMGTVPPENTRHRITESGITTLGHTYLWRELRSFYFAAKGDYTVLHVETAVRPSRLSLIVAGIDRNQLGYTLSYYLPHREVPSAGILEKLAERAARVLNLA